MNSGIYEIVNTVNGHRYIGSAVNIPKRWSDHKSLLTRNKHHSRYLQNAWNKYSADCFEFRVIEYCFFFMLIPREQYYLDTLHPKYNTLRTAGSCLGVKQSAETLAKLSVIRRGRTPWNKGLSYSLEYCKKLSSAHKGKKLSPEHCAKISSGKKGIKKTSETRVKMSAAKKLWWARRKQQAVGQ